MFFFFNVAVMTEAWQFPKVSALATFRESSLLLYFCFIFLLICLFILRRKKFKGIGSPPDNKLLLAWMFLVLSHILSLSQICQWFTPNLSFCPLWDWKHHLIVAERVPLLLTLEEAIVHGFKQRHRLDCAWFGMRSNLGAYGLPTVSLGTFLGFLCGFVSS